MVHIMQRIGLFVCVLLVSFPVIAQTGPSRVSFSLAEAQEYAVEHNRTLANASIDIRKAQYKAV